MENKNENGAKLRISLFDRVKPEQARKINFYLKIVSCLILGIMSLTLMSIMSESIKFLRDLDMIHIRKPGGPNGFVEVLNPTFKNMLASLILFIIATMVVITIIILIFKKKNVSLYKIAIIPFILILIGFFVSYSTLIIEKENVIADFNAAKAAGRTAGEFPHKLAYHFNTPQRLFISLSVVGSIYLTSIGSIIFVEQKFY